jgi:glutaminyl-tRNA synthetase
MKAGKYADGAKVLRAKIDLANPNMLLRDPILYRIKKAHHHRTGDTWCIYPMYDFAHGQSDAIEQITHSICTLEFIPHRALYDWGIENLGIYPSKQYEFSRLNITYTILSKRKLLQLVQEGHVASWDDPRMPTISGMRRRGYTPESIRDFCDRIGIAKRENIIDFSLLEFCVREHLNKIAQRRMVVTDPIKLVITNYEQGEEILQSENNPEDADGGARAVPFSKELWIERGDFMEEPTKKYFRLAPGLMVRLKSAYIVKCESFEKDAAGVVQKVFVTYVPESKSGSDTSGIHVKGTLHWVSAQHAVPVVLNEYDRLFKVEDVDGAEGDFKDYLNEQSLTKTNAWAEPALVTDPLDARFQFIRKGYFYQDTTSAKGELVFNRTVTLKDAWAKEQKK